MINLYEIEVGNTIKLKNGKSGICTENMSDGQWVEVEIDREPVLVHSQDIQEVTSKEEN